ncbi:hypothetical protein M514_01632 [Trichuris suis]|uniref:Uncharacterized protein n=1 Tax=Trichuris suis TaxID=68888 RepID=A0A085MJY3_9BILA|nr:hypothetical protein M513_01632 [Trichuris suis]KFD63564.1 hypothetical protein M514_01632 [Trichuris suis]
MVNDMKGRLDGRLSPLPPSLNVIYHTGFAEGKELNLSEGSGRLDISSYSTSKFLMFTTQMHIRPVTHSSYDECVIQEIKDIATKVDGFWKTGETLKEKLGGLVQRVDEAKLSEQSVQLDEEVALDPSLCKCKLLLISSLDVESSYELKY